MGMEWISSEQKSNGQTVTIPANCTYVVAYQLGNSTAVPSIALSGGQSMTLVSSNFRSQLFVLPSPVKGAQTITLAAGVTFWFEYFKGVGRYRAGYVNRLSGTTYSMPTEITTNPADYLFGACLGADTALPYDDELSVNFTQIGTSVTNPGQGWITPSAQSATNTETCHFVGDSGVPDSWCAWISLMPPKVESGITDVEDSAMM